MMQPHSKQQPDPAPIGGKKKKTFKEAEVSNSIRGNDSDRQTPEWLDSLPGLIWKADANGVYTYFNASWLRLRGRTLEQEKGLGWIEGVHPDDIRGALDIQAEAANKKQRFSRQFRLKGVDQQYRWIKDTGSPLCNGNRFLGYCGTGIDITSEFVEKQSLLQSLEQSEMILNETNHRIKNHLQMLCSLLNLQGQYSNDPKIASILQDCQARVQTIVLLHEKLFQSLPSADLNFSDYVQELVRMIFNSYKTPGQNISLDLQIDSQTMPQDKAIPCGLIVTELLTNCFKHAFRESGNGKVTVRFHLDNGEYVLEVKDGGIGLSQGIQINQSPSLGLKLVWMLANQLHGRASVLPGSGTSIQVRFPH